MNQMTTYCSDIAYNCDEFYQNHDSADCTIIIPGQEPILAHRAILSSYSSFFENSFTSGMQEDSKRQVVIDFNPCNMLPDLIEYMYTEYITLTQENIMPLMELSKYYGVNSLYEGLCGKLNEEITPENILYFVQVCYENNLSFTLEIISKCHVARLYDSLDRSEFTNIFDIKTFCIILTEAVLTYGFRGNLKNEVLQFMGNEQPQSSEEADALNSLSQFSKDVPHYRVSPQ